MKFPQIVHIVFQYIHDAFSSNLIEENAIIVLIFTNTIIVLSAVEINPYFVTEFSEFTPHHTTPHHSTTHPHHNNEITLQYSTR